MGNYPHAKFNEQIFNDICNELAQSNKGLKHICLKYNVSTVAFYSWIQNDENLLNKYTRAREQQADFLADEIIEISDDSSNDDEVIETQNGTKVIENKEWTNRSKLRVEARKWVASKLKPKKYGEKLDVTTGGEKLPAQNTIDLSKLDNETLKKLLDE